MLSIRDFLSSKIKYKRGTLLYKSLNNKCGDFFSSVIARALACAQILSERTADLDDGRSVN